VLEDNYAAVQKKIAEAAIRAGRNTEEVKLIAVTKTVNLATVKRAATLGIRDFGENRVQDAAEKVAALPELNWHFIGHLQSNKVKEVIPHYGLIHSLDRLSLAGALQKGADRSDLTVEALVQVNVSGEESKFGLEPRELVAFLDQVKIYDRLILKGLMTMAPFVDDPEETRIYFRRLRELRDRCRENHENLMELSMGMTNDYEVAVEEGATMVRIGSAIFNAHQ